MREIKYSIFAGIGFGFLFGLFFTLLLNLTYAVVAGSIAGIFFGLGLFLFVRSKTVKRQTSIPDEQNKKIIYSAGANHFKNGEAVGGKLYLFPEKLKFTSHNFNIQYDELEIEIKQIACIKYVNTFGIVPNGLLIETVYGSRERFVVGGRSYWKKAIEEIKKMDITSTQPSTAGFVSKESS
jgi:hypothetical protein